MKTRIKTEQGYSRPIRGHMDQHDGYVTHRSAFGSGPEGTPLEFDSITEAVAFLTSDTRGASLGYALEHIGRGEYSHTGTYELRHGQHSRPVYTIVSAKSGRTNKQIVELCELLAKIVELCELLAKA